MSRRTWLREQDAAEVATTAEYNVDVLARGRWFFRGLEFSPPISTLCSPRNWRRKLPALHGFVNPEPDYERFQRTDSN
jgi:hypothetical protein